ncbi:MAG TPA: UDP-N-acetylmuramate--L-alanine ligase [Armatimonadota bacterium]|nr:UDP-N-acetylmuramate--L-alanine ligase [Armatimonadota bacterium]
MLQSSDGPIHFMAIGGAGMSPLAEILLARGFRVSGSDIRQSDITDRLIQHGARVVTGPHNAASIHDATTLVRSTAIRDDNPELVAGREKGLRIMHRSELLGELLAEGVPVAVAGTHGKTTTSSMIAVMLVHAGLDPTAIVGGEVRDLGGHHRVGGDLYVLEACESDRSFLNYPGCNQVITNLEPDHLDQHGTFERVIEIFGHFVALGRLDGFLVYCADSPELVELSKQAPGKRIAYGMAETAAYRVSDVTTSLRGCAFTVRCPCGAERRVELKVPGEHNALNATSAFAVAMELGVDPETAIEGLAKFTGVGRRFDILYDDGEKLVVDDYAHHPTEIRATLRAAQAGWDGKVIAIFQPHLYSRTKLLFDDFAHAFGDADEVIITDIYAAREDLDPTITGAMLHAAIAEVEADKPALFLPAKERIVAHLLATLSPGDMAICIGAGDIVGVGEQVAAALDA